MALDRFLIGYTDENSGLQTSLKPWLIADNAFEYLQNAYVFRGRLRKRFGSEFMGQSELSTRLRIEVGTTDGAGAFSGSVPGLEYNVGQLFSIGTTVFTVYQTGTPANMLVTGTGTGTFNTTTGGVAIIGSLLTTKVYFYPAMPVMGIFLYYTPNNGDYVTIAFDTQFSYEFDDITNAWLRLDSGDSVWTGSDADFFWVQNYQGATPNLATLWVTNYTEDDGIRYYDGSTWTKPVLNYTSGSLVDTTDGAGAASGTLVGTFFIGQVFNIGLTSFTVTAVSGALTVSAGGTGTGTFDTGTGGYTFTGAFASTSIYFSGDNYIASTRLIISFRNRLLLLNTIEVIDGTATTFVNRCRYSAIGSPLAPRAWNQDIAGNGDAIDAPTTQAIVTAQFIKDRLIVFFEASTFELVYTGNEVLPFTWQKINTELGAESTFSQIPFDKFVLGVGNTGINACNGSNVDRIDAKIPQLVFSFHNLNSGVERIAGVRDFSTELAYWTYPSKTRNSSFYFPDKVLVYNYINSSWGIIDDSFTTFGYFLLTTGVSGDTWGTTYTPWGENGDLWNSSADDDNVDIKLKRVVAGNQEGFVVILRPDITSNCASLQVTNFTITAVGLAAVSCIDHNLSLGDYVLFTNMNGITFTDSQGNALVSAIGRVTPDPVVSNTPNSFSVVLLDNRGMGVTMTGTYTGGGYISRVSEINIKTKQYNFYTTNDRNCYVPKVDFMVDKTLNGQITVDFLISSSSLSIVDEGLASGVLQGDSILETSPYTLVPFENFQTRLWHPLYFYAEGECVQLNLYFSARQMYGYTLSEDGLIDYTAHADFQLHAMIFYAQATSNRMQ